jgi:hypothetical protein
MQLRFYLQKTWPGTMVPAVYWTDAPGFVSKQVQATAGGNPTGSIGDVL